MPFSLTAPRVVLAAAFAAFVAPAPAAQAGDLTTMGDVGAALLSCWSPPRDVHHAFVTLSFSFRRDGTLIGPARPVRIVVPGDDDDRSAFVRAAIKAVAACTPLHLAPGLAAGIGGQVFMLTFPSADRLVLPPAKAG